MTRSSSMHETGSQSVSGPDASSPPPFSVPGGQPKQALASTRSSAAQRTGSQTVSTPPVSSPGAFRVPGGQALHTPATTRSSTPQRRTRPGLRPPVAESHANRNPNRALDAQGPLRFTPPNYRSSRTTGNRWKMQAGAGGPIQRSLTHTLDDSDEQLRRERRRATVGCRFILPAASELVRDSSNGVMVVEYRVFACASGACSG